MALKVLKSTPGTIKNGRFVPTAKNPSKGTKYKKARLKEMIREAQKERGAKKKNAKRRTAKRKSR